MSEEPALKPGDVVSYDSEELVLDARIDVCPAPIQLFATVVSDDVFVLERAPHLRVAILRRSQVILSLPFPAEIVMNGKRYTRVANTARLAAYEYPPHRAARECIAAWCANDSPVMVASGPVVERASLTVLRV